MVDRTRVRRSIRFSSGADKREWPEQAAAMTLPVDCLGEMLIACG
jgi:hypothetical protein